MVNLRAFVRFDVEISIPEGIGSVPPYPCAIPEPSSNRTRPTLLFSSLLHKKPNHSIELSLCSRRGHNKLDEPVKFRAQLFSPCDEIIRAAAQVILMLRTQVLLHGGVTAAELTGVHGHLFAFGIGAYHRACVGNLHLPADVMERHAVAMSLHQYVIVLPDLAFGVPHHLERFFRKWRQAGLLGITEPLQPAITFLLHACLVMCVHTIGDGRVQRG